MRGILQSFSSLIGRIASERDSHTEICTRLRCGVFLTLQWRYFCHVSAGIVTNTLVYFAILEYTPTTIPAVRALMNMYDDVIKWIHFPRHWPFVRGIHRSPVNSPHKGQWRGALMFSLICTRINGWVNNGEAGDLWRHRAHYDATIMGFCLFSSYQSGLPHWQWARVRISLVPVN